MTVIGLYVFSEITMDVYSKGCMSVIYRIAGNF